RNDGAPLPDLARRRLDAPHGSDDRLAVRQRSLDGNRAPSEDGGEAPPHSPDHARPRRDRGDVAGGLVSARLGDGAERIEEAGIEAAAIVDREGDRAVAEALQHLAQAPGALWA